MASHWMELATSTVDEAVVAFNMPLDCTKVVHIFITPRVNIPGNVRSVVVSHLASSLGEGYW